MPGQLYASCSGGAWLTMDYYEGTVPGFGGVDNIPTHLDAANTAAGEVYTGEVVFTSVPNVGTITVPVTMIIMGAELVPPTDLEVELVNDITGQVSLTWNWAGDDFQFFMVKRDGVIVGTTTNTNFMISCLTLANIAIQSRPFMMKAPPHRLARHVSNGRTLFCLLTRTISTDGCGRALPLTSIRLYPTWAKAPWLIPSRNLPPSTC